MVVKDQEIADAVIFKVDHAVELVAVRLGDRRFWKQLDQRSDRRLDQIDARRFQGLEEAARKPNRNNIADPASPTPPGFELQHPRLGDRLSLNRADEF